MLVSCRKAGGKGPFGDVLRTIFAARAETEKEAVLKVLGEVKRWNRGRSEKVATLQCGNVLLDVKTGKMLFLMAKLKQ